MFAPTQWATNILSNKRIDVNAGNTEHSLERGPSNDDEIVENAGNIEHLSAITYECHICERSFFSDHGRSIHLHYCRKKISHVKNIVCTKIRILFHRSIARKSLYSYNNVISQKILINSLLIYHEHVGFLT